jgi:DNA modification methylase
MTKSKTIRAQLEELRVEQRPVFALKPNPHNSRVHSKKQIREVADSILAFGFATPLVVDEDGVLLAGHARLEAAKLLGLKTVPAVVIEGLSLAKKRALLLADNRIAENAGWDRQRLSIELPDLSDVLATEGLDIAITGFEPVEIDKLQTDFEEDSSDPADELNPEWIALPCVTRLHDIWRLGDHRLGCNDARDAASLGRFMGRNRAAMAFLDPPYNRRVREIAGRGRTRHNEFKMASGEMSPAEFIEFLKNSLGPAVEYSNEDAVHFVCIDWRHVRHLIDACEQVYDEMLNLVVWVKSNAGQGSFYRSRHELIGVFRVGDARHLNNVQLGRHGRSRSNVWNYAGVNTFGAERMAELQAHPTPKPVLMVADAIKDCTRRNDVVLDTFSGSGTTILAAERVGRRGFAVEIEPRYVDVAIRRWQAFTRRDAVHIATGRTFEELALQRVDAVGTHERLRMGRKRS